MAQFSGWREVPATTEIPAHTVFLKAIEKPETDDRDYRLIRLQNGLQALLIHDPKADKAAAAMDVGVGHLSDPDDMPGLAHFCEHLLFMGSTQFPQENAYSEFIHAHGGSTNAWTAASNTNYFFNIGADHLSGALQRFSGFFHSPLFDASCTTRELRAVNSEHKKNAQNDMWRSFQISKALSRPGHPYAKFGSGNLHSLTYAGRTQGLTSEPTSTQGGVNNVPAGASDDAEASLQGEDGGIVGRETRRRLVEWWETHYSASNMNLAVIGKDSLDDIMKMVTDNFSSVVTRKVHGTCDLRLHELPWGPEQQRRVVAIQTVMDFRMLQLQWVLPEQESNYESKPTTILSHFIGHEGPGSLHSYFKQKGWLTYLGSGFSPNAKGFGFFTINVMLTKTGLENWKTLVEIIFNYMSLLRTSDFPDWVFAELEAISEARFRFKQKRSPGDYVSSLAERLALPWSMDRIISGKTRLWKWDEPAVREMLEKDLAPEAVVLALLTKDFSEIGLDGAWLEEPWYKAKYKVFPLDEGLLEKARRPNQYTELFLPTPNEFIPTNFEVNKQPVKRPTVRPTVLRTTPISTLWYKKDDQFWLPKGTIEVEILSPIAGVTPRNAVMTTYVASLITDALTEFAYDAELAGLSYDISDASDGLSLTVGGYNEKAHVLLKRVLEKARTLVVDPHRFEVIREQSKQGFENFYVDQPYQIADWFATFVIHEIAWSPQERLDELAHITPSHVQGHLSELWQRTDIKILVHGNFSAEDALRVQDLVDTIVGSRGILPTECLNRSHLLPRPGNFVHNITLTNPKEANGAVLYYLGIGDQADDHLRTRLLLIDHLLKEPTFSVLRTKEQLGYVVQSMIWYRSSALGFVIRIQSERHPAYVEKRIETFLESHRAEIAGMNIEEFKKQRKGLIDKQRQRLENLNEESSRFWYHIESGYYDFTRRERQAQLIEKLTLNDVLEFYDALILPTSPTRSKLSVHAHPKAKSSAHFSKAASQSFLEDLKSRDVPVDAEQYTKLSAAEPSVEDVKKFWTPYLSNLSTLPKESATLLLARIDELSLLHPAAKTDEDSSLPSNVVVIGDLAKWKTTLQLSPPPIPYSGPDVEQDSEGTTPKL